MAVAATSAPALQGIIDSKSGLIQVVVDNFDADISLQNGKLSTHSLAVLVTQLTALNESEKKDTIQRIGKSDMSKSVEYDVNIDFYNGPKKPDTRWVGRQDSVGPAPQFFGSDGPQTGVWSTKTTKDGKCLSVIFIFW